MSYLHRLDSAAYDTGWDLVRGWIDHEPLPFFAELRAKRPILHTSKATLVALYDDVLEVLNQPSLFSVALYKPKQGDYLMADDDTPKHMRDKSIMYAVLNRDDLPRVRALVQKLAAEALASGGQGGELDMVRAVGRGVPIGLVQQYFGFEGIAAEKMAEWSYWNQYDAFHNQPFHNPPDPAAITANRIRTSQEMARTLVELVSKRTAQMFFGQKFDDVTSRLLRTQFPAEVGFPNPRMVLNIGGLLIGAVETTSQAVMHAAAELFGRPDHLAAARKAAAIGPDAFDGYFWEALRFRPISPYMFRVAEADVVLGRGSAREARIAKGTHVLPLVLSSNFDPSRFADPDEFNPARPRHHTFHLGHGLHECLGRYVAEVMMPEMLRQIVLAENLAPAGAIDYRGGPFPESWMFRRAA